MQSLLNELQEVQVWMSYVFRQKINFEPKWHIPLVDLTLEDKVDVDGTSVVLIQSFYGES